MYFYVQKMFSVDYRLYIKKILFQISCSTSNIFPQPMLLTSRRRALAQKVKVCFFILYFSGSFE